MKNKKWLLLLIIVFPSVFWLILETSSINSRKLPFYGPKQTTAKGDTLFYMVGSKFYTQTENSSGTSAVDSIKFPLYAVVFLSSKYRPDSYRLTGLWEYLNYKKGKIEHIPFILVTEQEGNNSAAFDELKKLEQSKNVSFYAWKKNTFDSLVKSYFKDKPYYIDYSFFMLVDEKRHIRGYYDGRYVSELKRLIEEYQHLRLKEEKQLLIEANEIKQDS